MGEIKKKNSKRKKQKDERKKKNFIIQKVNKKKQTPTLLGLQRLLLYRHNKHSCWNKLTNLPSITIRMLHCFHANRGFAQKEKKSLRLKNLLNYGSNTK